jgi:hypothetical protein
MSLLIKTTTPTISVKVLKFTMSWNYDILAQTAKLMVKTLLLTAGQTALACGGTLLFCTFAAAKVTTTSTGIE